MACLNADYIIEQGSTFVLEFQVFDDLLSPLPMLYFAGGGSYDFLSYRFRTKIRRTKYRDEILYGCGTTQNYIIQSGQTHEFVQNGFYLVGGNTGFVRMVINDTTTQGFKYGNYFYDVEMVKGVSGGEVVSKLISGKIVVDAETNL